jgi:uncharacterized RDD family membrane protein YckC
MKCPKCGYLGFETTDRCRNCGYDFSLAVPAPSPELPLMASDPGGPFAELTLAPAPVDSDAADPMSVVLAREEDPAAVHEEPPVAGPQPPTPVSLSDFPAEPPAARGRRAEELPLFPPPRVGSPLAVRRAPTDVSRPRRTTTRPLRAEAPPLPLIVEKPTESADRFRPAQAERPPEPVSAGGMARIAAALIDISILVAIYAAVAWLTLRIAGLDATLEALATLRPIPMAAFFLLLAFLYVAGFTLGGGQTIGKMALGLRVIGDDGRGVDASGAVVRAAGCLLAVLTLGLLFLPALLSMDRRAPYDRVAGTRVIRA